MCLALQSAVWERLVFASNCLAPTLQGQAPAGSCSYLLPVLWNMRASHTYKLHLRQIARGSAFLHGPCRPDTRGYQLTGSLRMVQEEFTYYCDGIHTT